MRETQLKYDNNFNNIIQKPPVYWKKNIDIPSNIKSFINDFSNNIIIHNNNNYYCSTCLNKLEDYYCSECKKQYRDLKYDPTKHSNIIDNVTIFDSFNYTVKRYYYVFDVVDKEVILYNICEENSRDIYIQFHRSTLSIENAYWIQNDRIIDLITNKQIIYDDIDKQITKDSPFNFLFIDFNLDIDINIDYYYRKTLYVDNLDILKDTIYKYTNIWDAKEFLKEYDFRVLNLTYIPLRYKQFEYLIKYKLYNLAFEAPHILNGKTFIDRFGLDKEYLSFMQKNNIDYYELLGLQLSKCKNIYLIGCLGWEYELAKELFKIINPNMNTLGEYLENHSIPSISEYCDYIKMAKEMGYDLSNKKVLYPEDLMKEHDKLYLQYEVLTKPEMVDNIKSLSNILSLNIYEDEKYIIFPADTIESMIDEGTQQHNCLRTYISSYSENECQIYFMRTKSKKDKSFVTIEVKNNKIVQAKTKYNQEPSKEIMKILRKWESTLLPINNGE